MFKMMLRNRLKNQLNVKTVFAVMFLALLVTSCATSLSYDDYLLQYVNISEEQLVNTWGEPQHQEQRNGYLYLTYTNQGQRNVMISPAIYEPYFDGKNVHHRLVAPERWTTQQTHCETIFIIEQSVVTQYLYSGNGCMAPTS